MQRMIVVLDPVPGSERLMNDDQVTELAGEAARHAKWTWASATRCRCGHCSLVKVYFDLPDNYRPGTFCARILAGLGDRVYKIEKVVKGKDESAEWHPEK